MKDIETDLQHLETYEYKIPTCLPNGEYLLRVHQLGIHNPYPAGIPQFYISCAQINVTGSTASASSFAPTLSIPGAFKDTDPGYTVNVSVTPCGRVQCCAVLWFADITVVDLPARIHVVCGSWWRGGKFCVLR